MTKLHRKKKAVASFLAGMFLLQGAFTGGITLKADAKEAAQKIKFEVVGEGNVTVTDVNDKVKRLHRKRFLKFRRECVSVYRRMRRKRHPLQCR